MYQTPLINLVHKAAVVHRMYNDPQMVRECEIFECMRL